MTPTQWLSCDDPHAMLKALAEQPRCWRTTMAAWVGLRHQGPSDRKVRLFAVGCCRRIWHLLVEPQSRAAVEVCEQFVDGLASRSELKAAIAAAAAVAAQGVHPATSSSKAVAQANGAEAAWAAAASPDQGHKAAVRARDALRALSCYVAPDSSKLRIQPAATKRHSSSWIDWSAISETPAKDGATTHSDGGETAWMAERRAQADLVRDIFGDPFPAVTLPQSCRVPGVVSIAQAIYEQRAFERMPELGSALETAGCAEAHHLAHCYSGGEHTRGCWVIDAILGKR